MTGIEHAIGTIIAVLIVGGIVVHDHFLPTTPEEELRRYWRGQKKRRERHGDTD